MNLNMNIQLLQALTNAKGNGTSMITVCIPANSKL